MRRSRSSPKLALAALALSLPAAPSAWAGVLPSFAEVRARYESSDGKLLDRYGQTVQELRLRAQGRALDWASLAELSPSLPAAVIAVEDRRFYEHGGVDLHSLAGAAWQNFWRGTRRGASTLTMQTVALLEEFSSRRGGRKSLWEKARQAQLAWEMEKAWTKEQILEAYFNLVSFRGEYRGVRAASRALFGRDPHGLDLREAYLLAALLRSPGMNAEKAGERLCLLAQQAPLLGPCPELRRFAVERLSAPPPPLHRSSEAPHLARRLLTPEVRERATFLDGALQRFALDAIRDQLTNLRAQNARDAALIAVDNRSGEVLAYVGSSGAFSTAASVDMVQTRRQAGSTLKPFLYAFAFDRGYVTPDSWLLDEPFELGLERGSYEPDNYDHRFRGPVPAKEALASSLNIPAVRLLQLVGQEPFRDFLGRLRFRQLESAEHYGPSLALGSADVTLFDLVQAYRALAAEGQWRPLRLAPGDPRGPAQRVLGAASARQVAAILADRDFRAATFGWDSVLATPYGAAVKTGTSKDMRDNWCVGFTREYTVGVWVGNSSGEPMWQVSGVSGAAPIWRAVMDRLHRGRKVSAFATLPASPSAFARGGFGRIVYPAPGALLAIDPDIPAARQRVPFEAEGEGEFFLDGERLAEPEWEPVAGKHRLSLRDRGGRLLDELSFEVR